MTGGPFACRCSRCDPGSAESKIAPAPLSPPLIWDNARTCRRKSCQPTTCAPSDRHWPGRRATIYRRPGSHGAGQILGGGPEGVIFWAAERSIDPWVGRHQCPHQPDLPSTLQLAYTLLDVI